MAKIPHVFVFYFQSSLAYKSAKEWLVDDIVNEELRTLLTSHFSDDISIDDVITTYDPVLPLDEWSRKWEELDQEKADHEQELNNLSEVSEQLWQSAFAFKDQSNAKNQELINVKDEIVQMEMDLEVLRNQQDSLEYG